MFNYKKLIVATSIGAMLGIGCFLGGKYLFNLPFTTKSFGFIILNRAMIGFVIGISSLRMNWAVHGMLIGAVVGSIFAYADYMFNFPVYIIVLVLFANPVFGMIIEFCITKIFKYNTQE